MGVLTVRFYAELNDFLPPESRARRAVRHFDVIGSVKDFIESLGVPHPEVDLVLVNGESVDFFHLLRDRDDVSVYPVFESFDISSVSRVRPTPLRNLRFVLDVHLGKLAAYLRMAGFDALYAKQASDRELAGVVAAEQRVLLTRDRYLLMRSEVKRGYWIRSTVPRQQLIEVLQRFHLAGAVRPFTRCMECNAVLERVGRDAVADKLPPAVAAQKWTIHRCPGCGRIYWKGSHHARIQKLLDSTLAMLDKDEKFSPRRA